MNIWQWLISLFKPKSQPAPVSTSPVLVLTHPQEPQLKTVCMDIEPVRTACLTTWSVPQEYWSFWKAVKIVLDSTVSVAESDYVNNVFQQIRVNPLWATPGVLVHEFGHISYGLLSPDQKAAWSAAYTPLKTTNPLIVFLYKQNPYGLTNDNEGHSEIFRYLSPDIPDVLKAFYPKLY